jgi:vesicle coat complex subunit
MHNSRVEEIDMATAEVNDLRSTLVKELLDRIEAEPYPSVTMLNMIESLLTPDELPEYVQLLMDRVHADLYPSIDMLHRIRGFV